MARCEFPNGTMERKDGTKYPITCHRPARLELVPAPRVDGHPGVLEHGYTDGDTVSDKIEKAALYRLLDAREDDQ